MLSIKDILEAQAREVARLRKVGSDRALEITKRSLAAVDRRLRSLPANYMWDEAAHQAMRVQLRGAIGDLSRKQLTNTSRTVKAASRLGWEHTKGSLDHLDRVYGGSVRSLRFDSLEWLATNSDQLSKIRLQEYTKSFTLYGAKSVKAVEDAVAQTVLLGDKWSSVRDEVWDSVRGVVEDRQWMVDRILRTEMSAMTNGIRLAALVEEDTDPNDPMFKRLISTFDERTGTDSVLLHGQMRRVNEPFYDAYYRKHYMAPPNRPNDREILVGWRASYGPNFDEPDPGGSDVPASSVEQVSGAASAPSEVPTKRRRSKRSQSDGPVAARERVLRTTRRATKRALADLKRKVALDSALETGASPNDLQRIQVLNRRVDDLTAELRGLYTLGDSLRTTVSLSLGETQVMRKVARGGGVRPSSVLDNLINGGLVASSVRGNRTILFLTALGLALLARQGTQEDPK